MLDGGDPKRARKSFLQLWLCWAAEFRDATVVEEALSFGRQTKLISFPQDSVSLIGQRAIGKFSQHVIRLFKAP
ncbi:hypothetical protein GCM10007207_27420 [Asaia siamensis]|uniref:Uncharacterized protein n=1 Tax=Asaia siamensis TaxID=110479 RepID=A0ABQ1MH77_9PROT|nr:hypothetical protein GCM10007207_27420 [Asaia siamensis]